MFGWQAVQSMWRWGQRNACTQVGVELSALRKDLIGRGDTWLDDEATIAADKLRALEFPEAVVQREVARVPPVPAAPFVRPAVFRTVMATSPPAENGANGKCRINGAVHASAQEQAWCEPH
jgi:hypothetical protein